MNNIIADDDDIRDAILFRFWIRAASAPPYGFPDDTAKALEKCIIPDDYREALKKIAKEKGINLPIE